MSFNEDRLQAVMNTGENWSNYKFLTESHACAKGSLDILNGDETRPVLPLIASTEDRALYAEKALSFKKRSAELYNRIAQTQTPETISIIREAPVGDARSAWKLLLEFYESQTKAAIYQMTQK
jgi:hypothetical protein